MFPGRLRWWGSVVRTEIRRTFLPRNIQREAAMHPGIWHTHVSLTTFGSPLHIQIANTVSQDSLKINQTKNTGHGPEETLRKKYNQNGRPL